MRNKRYTYSMEQNDVIEIFIDTLPDEIAYSNPLDIKALIGAYNKWNADGISKRKVYKYIKELIIEQKLEQIDKDFE